MSRLTKDRLAVVLPLLDRFRDKLRRDRFFSARALERELADLLRLGHQEVTGLVVDLAGNPDYRLVAAYYMENVTGGESGGWGVGLQADEVVPEFRRALAALYGVASLDAPDSAVRRTEFWRAAFADPSQGALPDVEYEGPRFMARDLAGDEHVLIPVYRRCTDASGRLAAGGGYESADLIRLVTIAGRAVRRDGLGRYTVLDGGSQGDETTLTSSDPKSV